MMQNVNEIIMFIRHQPIFKYVEESRFKTLANYLSIKSIDEGQFLFKEGEKTNGVYFLLSGRLRVLVDTSSDNPKTISFLNRGATVGEMALINGHTRSASVAALWKADLLFLSQKHFDDMQINDPKLAIKILKGIAIVLADKLRMTNIETVRLI